MTFSENLKRLMEIQKVSASQISRKTNLAQNSFTHWLRGDRKPTPANIVTLARYFHVSPSELDPDYDNEHYVDEHEFLLSDEEKSVVCIFRMLDDKSKSVAITLLSSLLSSTS